MLLKKPALAYYSSATLASSGLTNPPHPRPSACPYEHCRYASRRRSERRRAYATAAGDRIGELDELGRWPPLGDPPRPPSPYQIFDQPRGEPYTKASKRRFYELVKLYHPDRSGANVSGGGGPSKHTQAVMLERYRLVVAANDILSDPAKREAYDRWGQGWSQYFQDGQHHPPQDGHYQYSTHHRWRSEGGGGGAAPHRWPVDQDPMFNATWEDWEAWYREQVARQRRERAGHGHGASSARQAWPRGFFHDGSRRGQGPVYMNNYRFISILFLLAALGGAGQATRANEQARTHLERSQSLSLETSRALMEARQSTRGASAAGEGKDGRIRRFLRASGEHGEDEFDGRALRPGDEGLCAPALTKDRDQKRYWQRPPEDR